MNVATLNITGITISSSLRPSALVRANGNCCWALVSGSYGNVTDLA